MVRCNNTSISKELKGLKRAKFNSSPKFPGLTRAKFKQFSKIYDYFSYLTAHLDTGERNYGPL